MKRRVIIILSWLMVAAICAVIFIMSGEIADDSAAQSGWLREWLTKMFGIGFTEFFVRKAAHISEYAALGFWSGFAFGYTFAKPKYVCFGALFSLLYAVGDEFHQTFVPGRAGRFRDIMIDFGGILLGLCLLGFCFFLYLHFKKRKNKNV